MDLTLGAHDGVLYGEDDSGYLLFVNGEAAAPGEVFQATLSGGMETETITVTVKSRADDTISTDYKLTVKKEASTSAKITVTPSDATLYIYEKVSGHPPLAGRERQIQLLDGLYLHLQRDKVRLCWTVRRDSAVKRQAGLRQHPEKRGRD